MTIARKEIVIEGVSRVYHCISRCVRRAFLCGTDEYIGQPYEHRKYQMNEIKRVLTLLSSDSDKQKLYLEELGVAPDADELGLEFDDIKDFYISSTELKNKFKLLDEKLSSISGIDNSQFWSVEALSTAYEWEEIRQIAKEALILYELEETCS